MADIASPPDLYTVIENYFTVFAGHPSARDLLDTAVTEDFTTGLRGGEMWCGSDRLDELLTLWAQFFDQRYRLQALLSIAPQSSEEVEVTTRVEFFWRRWRPPSARSQEFTGTAFHTWTIRRVQDRLQVAVLLIDGFANLNADARRLLASPVLGLDVEE